MSATTAADSATELLRNSSTRQFWDTNYVDPSWIDSIIMLDSTHEDLGSILIIRGTKIGRYRA